MNKLDNKLLEDISVFGYRQGEAGAAFDFIRKHDDDTQIKLLDSYFKNMKCFRDKNKTKEKKISVFI